jgi:hypothetical protein
VLDPKEWEGVRHAFAACRQAAETTLRQGRTACHDARTEVHSRVVCEA